VQNDPYAVADGQGFFFRKYGSAGIAFLFGVIPVLVISGQVKGDLTLLQFCFL